VIHQGLDVAGLTVRFGDRAAVDGVDLSVGPGEVMCLLGPSGCGKSTLLRAVAGLQEPAAGRIAFNGEDLTRIPAHRRRVGLMFQDYALFPHLDVAANVGFGLRMQGRPKADVAQRASEVLELVGMAGAGHRSVGRLSGGEQQRVALARALAAEPRVLLLDEPVGALDRPLRARLLAELGQLLDHLDLTTVYVTHDQDEAFALGDRVAVMEAGRIVQCGPPATVWSAPATGSVARFLGFPTVEVTVARGRAVASWGEVACPAETPDGPAQLVLRPDGLRLDEAGQLAGAVISSTFQGDRSVVRVATAAGALDVRTPAAHAPSVGSAVTVAVEAAGVVVVGPEEWGPSARAGVAGSG